MLGLGGTLWRMAGHRIHGHSSLSRMLKMIGFTIIVCVVLALLLGGCVETGTTPTDGTRYDREPIAPYVCRIVDSEWNVVCYIYSRSSISCVPLSQTGVDY
jgi:hypothetical protein